MSDKPGRRKRLSGRLRALHLKDGLDRQSFPGFYQRGGALQVRLTAKDNQGSPDYIEIMDFRGYGNPT